MILYNYHATNLSTIGILSVPRRLLLGKPWTRRLELEADSRKITSAWRLQVIRRTRAMYYCNHEANPKTVITTL